MADRHTCVPLVGIFVAVTWGVTDLVRENRTLGRAATASAIGVLATLFAVTSVQTKYWTDAETLFHHALELTTDNWMAHKSLGLALALSGKERMEEAIPHFAEALRINPRHSDVHNNMAMALKATGRLEEAVEHYRPALARKPGAPIPLRNLITTLLQAGRGPEALELLRESERVRPGNAQQRGELVMPQLQAGTELSSRKDFAGAVLMFEQASALLSPLPPAGLLQWGTALLELNRYEEAAERFRIALDRDAQSGGAHLKLGFALSQLQRPAEAIGHCRQAYDKPGIRSGSFAWIGDIYRKNGVCREAAQVYGIISRGDPAYPAAAAGIAACAEDRGAPGGQGADRQAERAD
jgi:tetratricopeptide (TPR) repeat protein